MREGKRLDQQEDSNSSLSVTSGLVWWRLPDRKLYFRSEHIQQIIEEDHKSGALQPAATFTLHSLHSDQTFLTDFFWLFV